VPDFLSTSQCNLAMLSLPSHLPRLNDVLQEPCSSPAVDDDLEAESISNSPESWKALMPTADIQAVPESVLTDMIDKALQVICDNTDK
jgi:hypothetical protein